MMMMMMMMMTMTTMMTMIIMMTMMMMLLMMMMMMMLLLLMMMMMMVMLPPPLLLLLMMMRGEGEVGGGKAEVCEVFVLGFEFIVWPHCHVMSRWKTSSSCRAYFSNASAVLGFTISTSSNSCATDPCTCRIYKRGSGSTGTRQCK
jgi:hypothetical protein